MPDALFKRCQRLVGHLAFHFATGRHPKAVTEEPAAKDPGHRAFAFVDHEVQFGKTAPQQPHHPLTSLPAAHLYVAVVSVACETMAASFQFLVHFIEHHLAQ